MFETILFYYFNINYLNQLNVALNTYIFYILAIYFNLNYYNQFNVKPNILH